MFHARCKVSFRITYVSSIGLSYVMTDKGFADQLAELMPHLHLSRKPGHRLCVEARLVVNRGHCVSICFRPKCCLAALIKPALARFRWLDLLVPAEPPSSKILVAITLALD